MKPEHGFPDNPHEAVWGDWYVSEDGPPKMWRRDCQAEGCEWRQMTSEEPGKETPLGKALNKVVGIE